MCMFGGLCEQVMCVCVCLWKTEQAMCVEDCEQATCVENGPSHVCGWKSLCSLYMAHYLEKSASTADCCTNHGMRKKSCPPNLQSIMSD